MARRDSQRSAPPERLTSVPEAWRTDFVRGLHNLAKGDFTRAAVYFERAHQRAPLQPELCFALGRERLRQGQLGEAERLLTDAWNGDRSLAAAAAGLVRCVGVGLRRFAQAHAIVLEARALHPDEAGLWIVEGELYLEEERVSEAQQSFEAALALLPPRGDADPNGASSTRSAAEAGLARTWNLDGILLSRAGRVEEALFSFKRACDRDPEWSGPLLNLGVAFATLGRPARARSSYERALVKDPHNLLARLNLGKLERQQGRLGPAVEQLKLVLDHDPGYPGAAVALADVLLAQGAPSDAIQLLLDELDREPAKNAGDGISICYQLGVCFEATGDLDRAERSYRNALAKMADHVPTLCRLAALLARDGRYVEAAVLARRAEDVDPAGARVRLSQDPELA
jgi:tetratricopeptide (TPR) repeat protein